VTTVLLAVGFFAFAMAAMAAGVILSDRQLKGSCGGKGGEDCVCEIEKQRECAANKRMRELMIARGVDPDSLGDAG
jgi:hypothetical protein